jgi:hypothetical protein
MKVVINGAEVNVERLTATTNTEQWCQYTLSDGTVIRIKPVLTGVLRLEGQWNDSGDPIYHLSAPIMIAVDHVPSELRKESAPAPEVFAPMKGKPQ